MVAARAKPGAAYLTDTLPTLLPPIFEQVQHTTANHRKNVVALRKIHDACAAVTESTPKGTKLVGEKAFNTLLIDMVNRVLPIKKGVAVADRVVKFVAAYVSYTTEQGEECVREKPADAKLPLQRVIARTTKRRRRRGSSRRCSNICWRVWRQRTKMSGLGSRS